MSILEPIWVSGDVVRVIHDELIVKYGGSPGIRDENLLLSALAKPENLYAYSDPKPDIAALAASYACGIARNHAFVDCNKRTSFLIAHLFLRLNGFKLTGETDEKFFTVITMATGELSEEGLADWLREHISALSD